MHTGSTRLLVDPELLPFLDSLPANLLTVATLPALRNRPPWLPIDPADLDRTQVTETTVPGPTGAPDVPISIYLPHARTGLLRCILHIHGGGFVMGAAAELRGAHLPLAADLGCCIVSVDYRLAPETRFPGAVEDCYAALRWLHGNAADLGIDPSRIGVMGESAGGGLAAALALLARDRGEVGLAFQHLTYPMLDDRTCLGDAAGQCGEFVWTPGHNRFGWSSLLGHEPGLTEVSPYAAPARATDLAGLPPTYIASGALDLFLAEDLEYAKRLALAGVAVEVNVYPGAFHAFNAWPFAAVAQRARNDGQAALARLMGVMAR